MRFTRGREIFSEGHVHGRTPFLLCVRKDCQPSPRRRCIDGFTTESRNGRGARIFFSDNSRRMRRRCVRTRAGTIASKNVRRFTAPRRLGPWRAKDHEKNNEFRFRTWVSALENAARSRDRKGPPSHDAPRHLTVPQQQHSRFVALYHSSISAAMRIRTTTETK